MTTVAGLEKRVAMVEERDGARDREAAEAKERAYCYAIVEALLFQREEMRLLEREAEWFDGLEAALIDCGSYYYAPRVCISRYRRRLAALERQRTSETPVAVVYEYCLRHYREMDYKQPVTPEELDALKACGEVIIVPYLTPEEKELSRGGEA